MSSNGGRIASQLEEASNGIVGALEDLEDRIIARLSAIEASQAGEASNYIKVNKAGRPIDEDEDGYEDDEDDGPLPSNAVLGSGTFAVTFRMKCASDGQLRAVKVVKAKKAQSNGLNLGDLHRETRIMSTLTHENIARYFVSFFEGTRKNPQKYFHIVMEYIDGDRLYDHIERDTSAGTSLEWARQLASALSYMHKKKFQHRDLKSQNIMVTLDGMVVKIIDLGLACASHTTGLVSKIGTEVYKSWEKAVGNKYGTADDMWALGLVLAELASGKHLTRPIWATDRETTAHRKDLIGRAQRRSALLGRVVGGLLVTSQSARLTASRLTGLLRGDADGDGGGDAPVPPAPTGSPAPPRGDSGGGGAAAAAAAAAATEGPALSPLQEREERNGKKLLKAATLGKEREVRILLDSGVSANYEDSYGEGALHLASTNGNLPSVELLLKAGANKDKQSKFGETPLMIAAYSGKIDVVEALLKAGARKALRDTTGKTAMDKAQRENHPDIVELLLSGRSGGDGGVMVVGAAAAAAAAAEVRNLSTVEEQQKNGKRLLTAATLGKEEEVRTLLNSGVHPDFDDANDWCSLHWASAGGHISCVTLLLLAGAKIDVQGWQGTTPLIWAAYGGKIEVVEELLNAGADKTLKDTSGRSALDFARSQGHSAIVELLNGRLGGGGGGGNIPTVNPKYFGALYDPKTKQCAGYLTKKGGSSGGGMFSKRNWNKRLFVIETSIDDTHNYTMKYFKENAKRESGLVPLQGTRVVIEHREHTATDVGYEFTILGAREKDFELYAETNAERVAWMSVLHHVAEVANARDAYFKAKGTNITQGENKIVLSFENQSRASRSERAIASAFARSGSGGICSVKKKNMKVLVSETAANFAATQQTGDGTGAEEAAMKQERMGKELLQAVRNGNEKAVRILLGNGTGPDAYEDEITGYCALHWACLYGNLSCVKLLLKAGANRDKEGNGMTPLMIAVDCSRTEVVKELLKSGEDEMLKDNRGDNALDKMREGGGSRPAILWSSSSAVDLTKPHGKPRL